MARFSLLLTVRMEHTRETQVGIKLERFIEGSRTVLRWITRFLTALSHWLI